MSGVIRLARRELCQTQKLLATREPIDFVARPAKRVPRQHKTPATVEEYTGREPGMINHVGKGHTDIKSAKKCPWCKETTVGDRAAIVCSVYPTHNWIYSADSYPFGQSHWNKKSKLHEEDKNRHQDEKWRVIDTRRIPADPFTRPDRYFDKKMHLGATDPWRMTTPVTHKIVGWAAKYGTKPC
ncbi:unnamed protein product [Oikopleura dioica]|uniref:Uncharacterized protein n=1 Tax=Oikopleura dioica TaxID=34765 RepID=E4YN94_OIKDI|nr:unnamed protein product [Oikopleura dioica]